LRQCRQRFAGEFRDALSEPHASFESLRAWVCRCSVRDTRRLCLGISSYYPVLKRPTFAILSGLDSLKLQRFLGALNSSSLEHDLCGA
jgi:hypothetical protein